ncbi:g3000 [Coccomyxa elongata]
MHIRNVLVCGATGQLGTYITNGLLDSPDDFNVSILVREIGLQDPSKQAVVTVLQSRGAKVVFVPDVSFTLEGLIESLQGFDCVISAVGTPSVESQYIMLEAALRAGVQRFIPSSWGFDFDKLPQDVHPVWDAKRKFHQTLIDSDMDYTIICLGVIYESFFTPFFRFDLQKRRVLTRGDPDAKFAVTSYSDIARWLPKMLLDPACRNAHVNVYSQIVTFREAVECFEEAAGAPFNMEIESRASPWRCGQANCWCGFTDCVLYIIAQGGAVIDNAWNVARGEQSTSMREFAERVVTRRLPALTYLAIRGEKTLHSPSHTRVARSRNAIMVESVLSDDFPWPVLSADCG